MHDQEQFVDEDTYFAVREEQLVRKLECSATRVRAQVEAATAGRDIRLMG
jgi:hypothetical protein